MQMKSEGVVTGFTKFKGDIDGQAIDANTVFVQVDIGNMGKGFRTEPMKCANEEVIKKIEHLPFPFSAALVIDQQATAKKTTLVVIDIAPVKPVQKAA